MNPSQNVVVGYMSSTTVDALCFLLCLFAAPQTSGHLVDSKRAQNVTIPLKSFKVRFSFFLLLHSVPRLMCPLCRFRTKCTGTA